MNVVVWISQLEYYIFPHNNALGVYRTLVMIILLFFLDTIEDVISKSGMNLYHIEAKTKCLPLLQTTFWSAFSSTKNFSFDWNLIEMCFLGSKWQYASVGLDNGLIHWRIYVSLGLNELRIMLISLNRLTQWGWVIDINTRKLCHS